VKTNCLCTFHQSFLISASTTLSCSCQCQQRFFTPCPDASPFPQPNPTAYNGYQLNGHFVNVVCQQTRVNRGVNRQRLAGWPTIIFLFFTQCAKMGVSLSPSPPWRDIDSQSVSFTFPNSQFVLSIFVSRRQNENKINEHILAGWLFINACAQSATQQQSQIWEEKMPKWTSKKRQKLCKFLLSRLPSSFPSNS
jgi:hypothetical protein